ncbi:hypothetical protein IGI04_012459 [Brassica rapa subsp. trilocularis]|uniref:Uncharacterized protein n=2 Tax=Brassica campestris TaxID=3711 RepID=A0ABQ7N618_BRACM|nr:hypothetical protein IGI04_012459 [Brassica rapa subsp. trilocularis]
MISAQQRQPPRLPPSRSKNPKQEHMIDQITGFSDLTTRETEAKKKIHTEEELERKKTKDVKEVREEDFDPTSSTLINKKPDRSTLIAVTELLFDGRSRILSGPKLTFIAKGQCCDMEPAIVEIYKNIGEKYSRLRYLEDAKEDNKTKWWI